MSQDWDEVRDFRRRVYMPYRVRPLGHDLAPDATMRQARIGGVIVTRFARVVLPFVARRSPVNRQERRGKPFRGFSDGTRLKSIWEIAASPGVN